MLPFGVYNTTTQPANVNNPAPTALRMSFQPLPLPPQPFQSVPLSSNRSNSIQRQPQVPSRMKPLLYKAQASELNPQGAMSLLSSRPVGQPRVPPYPRPHVPGKGNRGGSSGSDEGRGQPNGDDGRGPSGGPNSGLGSRPGGEPNGGPGSRPGSGRPGGRPGNGPGNRPGSGPPAVPPPCPPGPPVPPGPPIPPGPPVPPGGTPRPPDKPFVFQKKIKWELVPSWDGDGNSAIKWIKEVDNFA
jgi:hypothetical protein